MKIYGGARQTGTYETRGTLACPSLLTASPATDCPADAIPETHPRNEHNTHHTRHRTDTYRDVPIYDARRAPNVFPDEHPLLSADVR